MDLNGHGRHCKKRLEINKETGNQRGIEQPFRLSAILVTTWANVRGLSWLDLVDTDKPPPAIERMDNTSSN